MIARLKRLRCVLSGGHRLDPIWKTSASARLVGYRCSRCEGTFRS